MACEGSLQGPVDEDKVRKILLGYRDTGSRFPGFDRFRECNNFGVRACNACPLNLFSKLGCDLARLNQFRHAAFRLCQSLFEYGRQPFTKLSHLRCCWRKSLSSVNVETKVSFARIPPIDHGTRDWADFFRRLFR